MNYRKNSEAIHSGETKHFAPQNGTYLITRKAGDEIIVLILNKNKEAVSLDLERFSELNLEGKTFKNLISEETFEWENSLELSEEGFLSLPRKWSKEILIRHPELVSGSNMFEFNITLEAETSSA